MSGVMISVMVMITICGQLWQKWSADIKLMRIVDRDSMFFLKYLYQTPS